MSRTISRIAGVIISLVFVIALFPGFKIKAASIVDQGDCSADGSNVTWTLDSDGMLTISGSGAMKDYDASASNTTPFFNNANITKVVIENGVTHIGSVAFYYCTNVTEITIPNTVTSIGKSAFVCCESLASITLPNSITSIESYTFSDCYALKSITIPNLVKTIGLGTFSGCCSLEFVTIPNSVTSIGNDAFSGCTSLRGITIPNSVTSIGNNAFYNCTSLTSITIPNSVTSIGICSFYNCRSLTSITIPNSVTSIGDYAFNGCRSLTSITIPDSVTSIGDYAFRECTNIASITIDKNLYDKCMKENYRLPDMNPFYGISSDTFHFYYDATYTTSTAGGKISGNAKVHETDEITIKPNQHYSVDKVVLTVKDQNGNDVEKELSPVNGKYLMPDYDFNNWTGDCKVIASFKLVEYEITFKNYDDTVLEAKKVKAGETPTYTGKVTPTKPSVGADAYEFAGWDPLPGAVTGPATYIAVYNKTEAKYTVTFVDNDGVVIYKDTVKYHEVPVFKGNTTPVREETDTHKFTFAGWTDGKTTYSLDQGLPQIESDTTFSPVFDPVVKPVYTVGEVKGDGINSDIVIDVHRNVDDDNCLTYFLGATIDGTEMKANDQYTATKGSTIITIKKDFLSTLSSGEHEVQVVFNDGSVSTKVTVAAKPSVPATGESTGTSTYIGLALAVAACVCGTGVILLKKRKEA